MPQQFLHQVILYEIVQSFGATFVSKFVAKNFQKSPNPVTLALNYLV